MKKLFTLLFFCFFYALGVYAQPSALTVNNNSSYFVFFTVGSDNNCAPAGATPVSGVLAPGASTTIPPINGPTYDWTVATGVAGPTINLITMTIPVLGERQNSNICSSIGPLGVVNFLWVGIYQLDIN